MRNVLAQSTVILSLLTASATAQDGAFDLGTIVLRGELQDRTLQQTQSSVAVVTGEELERRGDQEFYDVIERTPGIVATQGEQGFSIRGIDQRGTGGGIGLTITTQVDGVALPTNESTFFGPFGLWDVDQIEIFRGPQSTQQGRNALAGAVVIRSKDPSYDREASLRAEYGSRNYYRFAFMANTPLIEDRLAFRLSGVTQREDGFVFNPVLGTEYDPSSIDEIRGKLRWNPTDNFEAIASFSITENFGGEDFIEEALFPARINRANRPSFEGSKHTNTALRMKYDFDNAGELRFDVNFYVNDYNRGEDFDFSPADLGFITATGGSDVLEADLQYSFETDRFKGVVGGFFTQIDNDIQNFITGDVGFSTTGIPNGFIITNFPAGSFQNTITNYAIYGEIEVETGLPGLSLIAGARYDFEELELVPGAGVAGLVDNTLIYDAFLPKVGVIYAISEDQSLSLTYQRGYRAGSAFLNIAQQALDDVDPEFTDTVEIAYRGSFLDDRINVAGNVFYTQWEDQQVFVFPVNAINRLDRNFENAASSELYGLEFSVDAEVTSKLDLFASLAYVQTEFSDFPSPIATDLTRNFRGNQFPFAPEVTAAFGAQYEFTSNWSAGIDFSYTDAFFGDASNDPARRVGDRWVSNLQINYTNGDFSAGLFVRNLFDNDYLTSRIDNRLNTFRAAQVPPLPALFDARAGDPRTVGFFVQQDF